MLRNSGSKDKIALFIDAGNLAYMTMALHMRIDYGRFREYFKQYGNLVYAGYYTGVAEDDLGNRKLQPLLDWLADHEYTLVTKPTKSYTQSDGSVKVKGNMDTEITYDMAVMSQYVDRLVLVTGDGDFAYPVREIVRKCTPVDVVASREANMLSGDLRAAASRVIDLVHMRQHIISLPT